MMVTNWGRTTIALQVWFSGFLLFAPFVDCGFWRNRKWSHRLSFRPYTTNALFECLQGFRIPYRINCHSLWDKFPANDSLSLRKVLSAWFSSSRDFSFLISLLVSCLYFSFWHVEPICGHFSHSCNDHLNCFHTSVNFSWQAHFHAKKSITVRCYIRNSDLVSIIITPCSDTANWHKNTFK